MSDVIWSREILGIGPDETLEVALRAYGGGVQVELEVCDHLGGGGITISHFDLETLEQIIGEARRELKVLKR